MGFWLPTNEHCFMAQHSHLNLLNNKFLTTITIRSNRKNSNSLIC